MTNEDDVWLNQMKQEADDLRSKNTQLTTALSSYAGQGESNSIEYQLDADALLLKIENFLRGARKVIKEQGNELIETYEVPTDKEGNKLYFLNEDGVNSIMVLISQYIDKNTMLSFYTEERINEILADLGDELAYYFFNNYEKMGMDNDFKKSRYPLTVLNILHTIESAYRKAIRGQTSENINTSKIYTQSELIGQGRSFGQQQPAKKKFNLFKLSTW